MVQSRSGRLLALALPLSCLHSSVAFVPQKAAPLGAFAPKLTSSSPGRLSSSASRRLAFGFNGFQKTSMGLLDALLGGMGGKREYSDLKSGTWAAEAAEYAAKGEVKTHAKDGLAIATFGGGCFWGIELAYQRVPGVYGTAVGYCNGKVEHPSYEMVCTGSSGHTEAVQMTYDPKEVSYAELCKVLFGRINPSLKDQVGNDRGTQYRHGIYYHSPEQKEEAEKVVAEVKEGLGGKAFHTEFVPVEVFYPAEEYHQQYLEKGGRMGNGQSAAKGCTDTIRCYG